MGTFANRLRDLRTGKEWTQERLAEELGISKSTVGMYELGKREPDFETLENIADTFNVDMNYLTGWSDDPIDYDAIADEIPLSYVEACNGDIRQAYAMMNAVDEDAKRELSEDAAVINKGLINPDIRNIARAAGNAKLTEEEASHLLKYAKMMWPEAFNEE